MKKGKIQTTEYNVNMLVDHEDATSQHYSSLNKEVLCEKMTDEEIHLAYPVEGLTIIEKIEVLKKIPNYAKSDCCCKNNSFTYGDLFKYKLINE